MEFIVHLLIIAFLWSIFYVSIYIHNKKYIFKTSSFDSLAVVHHNCYSFTARHIYLIKVFYGRSRKKFFFLTKILLEFIDENNITILLAKIPPMVLFLSQKEGFKEEDKGKAKLLAFILQTKASLTYVDGVRINHDCKVGDLFIYEIRIIDLIKQDTYVSFTQSWIRSLTTGAQPRTQIFAMTPSGRNVTDIKPSPYLNFQEMGLFFLLGIHWILFHTQYIIFNTSLTQIKRIEALDTMSFTALLSAMFAFLLITISLAVYYWIIKRVFSEMRGIGFIWILRYSYLLFIVFMSLMFGLIAAFKSDDIANTYKWFALLVGIVIYTLAFLTIALMCQCFGFFVKNPESYELRSVDDKSFKSIKTVKRQEMKTDSNQSVMGAPVSSGVDNTITERTINTTKKMQSNRSEETFKTIP